MKNTNKKKITFFSIVLLVMSSTIGAGIFFKNKTLSIMAQGHFAIVLATWSIGIFTMIALALSLVEITSSQKNDKGVLEWVRKFCPQWVYKSSNIYIKWIFIPITMFTMPLYFVNTLEDAGLSFGGEMGVLAMAFAVFVYFMVSNLISLRFSEVSQWIFTIIKMVPLLALPIYGFINYGDVQGSVMVKNVGATSGLTGYSPFFALIAGISAISFAYDGFYTSASLRNEMQNPKRIGFALVGGVLAVSVVYLFLTIGFNVAGDGNLFGMTSFMSESVFKMFNSFIAIGILGIINGFAISTPRQFRDLAINNEFKEVSFLQKLLFKNSDFKNEKQSFVSAWSFMLLTSTAFFIIFGFLGAYVYQDNGSYEGYNGSNLYGFSDVMTNFTSLLIFVIIATSILGGIINRKTKKVRVQKSKLFLPMGIITVTILYASSLYMIIESIFGMSGFNKANVQSNALLFIIFVSFITISIIPPITNSLVKSKRFIKTLNKVKS